MKKKTDESLKMYVDLIGTETEDGNINVSDEFLDNVSNVYIMGRTGTVNHGMTETSDTQIRIMEWRYNNETTEKKFEEFISLLNDYWGEPDDINKSTYSWGVKEQWCYSDYRYIYFEDGIVTSIHE